MPTKKQRRRALKERRHEYETVWVDEEGNELDDPPEDLAGQPDKRDGAKPKAKAKTSGTQQRGGRQTKVPTPPSWQRAAKRAGIIGAVLFVFIYIVGAKNGSHSPASALLLAVIYTLLFIPFTFYIDRFSYNRWQRRQEQAPKGTAKKR